MLGNNFWSINLGVIDLNFLEFLSFGNNFFLIWLVSIWWYFFLNYFGYFFSMSYLFFFRFYNIFFFNRIIFNFGFYEYFSIIFPFFGIFISLSLNFLLLSIGNSEMLGINFLLLIIGKQWGWDIFYYFSFGSIKLIFFFNFFGDTLFFNFYKIIFFTFKTKNLFFNFLLNSSFKKEFLNEDFFYSKSMNYFFLLGKDFSIEGINGFIFILEGFFNVFYVTSLDVIHSIGFISLGEKLDVIPGFFSGGLLEIQGGYFLDIFEFGCFEYCGVNHSSMFGNIFILNLEYFFYLL